jgi:hypothetical protein
MTVERGQFFEESFVHGSAELIFKNTFGMIENSGFRKASSRLLTFDFILLLDVKHGRNSCKPFDHCDS